jgi:hypothetical protein
MNHVERAILLSLLSVWLSRRIASYKKYKSMPI